MAAVSSVDLSRLSFPSFTGRRYRYVAGSSQGLGAVVFNQNPPKKHLFKEPELRMVRFIYIILSSLDVRHASEQVNIYTFQL